MIRIAKWLAIAAAVLVVAAPSAAAKRETDADVEKRLGQEAAAEADCRLKYVTDEKYTKRLERIGQELAAVAKVTKVTATYGSSDLADYTYTFKVVDDKTVNAFSLPAGYVYVNKGLMDRVESDDELAGVVAHEVAHIAHHHMLRLLQKQSQYDRLVFLIMAAAVAGKAQSTDVQNIFYGARLFEIAKLNAYSQEAENDADATAIQYMLKTKYNPVGILTFMEKLARDQSYDPKVADQGILMTHPLSRDRAANIITLLKKYGVPINRRAVSVGIEASVRDTVIKSKKVSQVVVGDRVIFEPADTTAAASAERAKAMADALNRQFEQNPEPRDVRLSGDGTAVYVKQELVVDVRQEDADMAGASRESLATRAKEAIQAALLSEQMKLLY